MTYLRLLRHVSDVVRAQACHYCGGAKKIGATTGRARCARAPARAPAGGDRAMSSWNECPTCGTAYDTPADAARCRESH